MYIQINIWGSRDLASWLISNYENELWLNTITDPKDREYALSLQPRRIHQRCEIGQLGSLFPKLLYFYELPQGSPFVVSEPSDNKRQIEHVASCLGPYYDNEIGWPLRQSDKDNIAPYPYLHVDYEDYFVTHNIYSKYADEDFLRLLRSQLDNYCSSHCYMTHIKAYDEHFDICYQSTAVLNPFKLKDKVKINECPKRLENVWLGQKIVGYPADDIERSAPALKLPENCELVTTSEVKELIAEGLISAENVAKIELIGHIHWLEHLDPKHTSLLYDLLGSFFKPLPYSLIITASKSVAEVPFDWVSPGVYLDQAQK